MDPQVTEAEAQMERMIWSASCDLAHAADMADRAGLETLAAHLRQLAVTVNDAMPAQVAF